MCPQKNSFDVIVVGAGPAGMMAAIAAAEAGSSVALCEQLDRAGVKLLATGGGRCNLTNTLADDEFMSRFGRNGRFMQPALTLMNAGKLIRFLSELGVRTHSPDGFHVYPVSNRAAEVQQALLKCCLARHVALLPGTEVLALEIADGRIRGVRTAAGTLAAPVVILATGGKSYPEMGATGTGYELSRKAGHTIVAPVPVLVSLTTRETWPRQCAGVSVAAVRVSIEQHPRVAVRDGDLLFTHRGVSGPAVLDLSRELVPLFMKQREVGIRINLAPQVARDEWLRRFEKWHAHHGRRSVAKLIQEHFPSSLADQLAKLARIPDDLPAAAFDRDRRDALADLMTMLPLTGV